jgi:carbamoyltransferase
MIYKNIHTIAAELLLNKKIIGWFQGRMEFGPRALGNRSIISSPFPVTQKDKINKQVKHREYFRPFAPAILIEKAKEYFNLKFKSPFMLLAVSSKKNTLIKAPAIVHYDGSARVQTVEKSVNLNFYKLIKEFYNKSGVPILLNTSFNDKGEPIVCSPEDALNTFLKTRIDFLIMNNILIKK